ncbi:LLM class flavin-dependent oxidoreductase [Flavobacterium sp. NKUCC04_CG]|uniref:LLM class flavin-dependent oxidoreductase n=1 Tax=Flavobacterium sp. NKUCC04_CG TaxID=2842121 RepID=UPI001C5A618D|nr:LLM class flavin-dependent oxidoreductase [Flavobacterium sp. NKUCC04_CG]MBW3517595.1 LLM class flavin-dependent oxidoreductase [Flavobacterium sp. NKUCC04_CG]
MKRYKPLQDIPVSVLDLAVIGVDISTKQTLNNSLLLAQHVEALGYKRFWVAEHHNMPYIASSATAVLIGYLAQGTETIRIGSGGIMLPNHAPLVIAEQFGTLESLYPGRIDLGLGRAPGTDGLTAMALRRTNNLSANYFPEQVAELQQFFSKDNAAAKVRAFPGDGLEVPLWILGSSTDSAHLAAKLGLPYAFASHFAPEQIQHASQIYKNEFQPSEKWTEPYFLACVNAVIADTQDEARRLSTSLYQMFLGIIRNDRKPMQKPVDSMDEIWSEEEENLVYQKLSCSFIGTKDSVKTDLQRFCDVLEIDELMITSPIYDHQARLKSFGLFKQAMS